MEGMLIQNRQWHKRNYIYRGNSNTTINCPQCPMELTTALGAKIATMITKFQAFSGLKESKRRYWLYDCYVLWEGLPG
jgi:hypothetical protein